MKTVKFSVLYNGVNFMIPLIPEMVKIYTGSKIRQISNHFSSAPTIVSRSSDGNYVLKCYDPGIYLDIPDSDNLIVIDLSEKSNTDDTNDEKDSLSSLIINDDNDFYSLSIRLNFEIDDNTILVRPVIEDPEDGFVYEEMDEVKLEFRDNDIRPYKNAYIYHPYFEKRALKIYTYKVKKSKFYE